MNKYVGEAGLIGLLLLGFVGAARSDTPGVTVVRPITFSYDPAPVQCGSTGTITAEITFEVNPSMMEEDVERVFVTAELWDDDWVWKLFWGGDDHMGNANETHPILNTGDDVHEVTKTFTFELKCNECTMEGNLATSGEGTPAVYLDIIDADTEEILSFGTSEEAYVSCVQF